MNEKLLGYLQANHRTTTVQAYYREIVIYLTNNDNAQNYNYSEVVNYLGALRNKYTNPKTISRTLASIKAYYSYLLATELRTDNPAKSIRLRDKISRDIQLQNLFSNIELEELLVKKERYINLELRNKLVVSLLIYQGLKPNEIECLEIEDVKLNEGIIYIKSSAKNNGRTLALRANQVLLFKNYLEVDRVVLLQGKQTNTVVIGIRGEPMTAEDITKHVKRNYKLFAPRVVNCQTIRQSVIRNLLAQNNDLRVVQAFAGHKYPSTTEKYKQTHLTALQTALELFHPMR